MISSTCYTFGFDAVVDKYNGVTFAPVKTTGLKVAVQIQPGRCGDRSRRRRGVEPRGPQARGGALPVFDNPAGCNRDNKEGLPASPFRTNER
jgi:hypothetical protein